MIVDKVQKVPLKVWSDGSICIAETQVPVETVIGLYLNGEIPEAMVEMFPALNVADIYSVISYYLTHKTQMDEYIRRRNIEAESIRQEIESAPGYAERSETLRQTLLKRWNSLQRNTPKS